MSDHTESLQIDFDPTQIEFAGIAELFWRMHNPCSKPYSRQYMTAIWYHNENQKEVLVEKLEGLKEKSDDRVYTPIEPLGQFYLAENYHQKYRLQSSRKLMKRFKMMYPSFADFNNSTAAARLNGFVSGRGNRSLFDAESRSYGFELAELESAVRF